MKTRYRKCELCRSTWPAITAIEAFRNRQRRNEIHPRQDCQDKDGTFGPSVKPFSR